MSNTNITSKEVSLDTMRHLMASIALSDVTEEERTEAEQKDYCAAIYAVFPRLEKDLKDLLHAQLTFMATNGVDMDQIQFARGTFNGLSLALEMWKRASMEHEDNMKGDEDNPLRVVSEGDSQY